MLTSLDRRSILTRIINAGFQITPDALDYIMSLPSPIAIIENLIQECISDDSCTMISPMTITDYLGKQSESEIYDAVEIEDSSEQEPLPTDLSINDTDIPQPTSDERILILKNPQYDSVGSSGTVEDFLALFKDRFKRIHKIYMNRIDTSTAISPKLAFTRKEEARAYKALSREGGKRRRRPLTKVIGMVRDKSVSRSRNVIIQLEDAEGVIMCVIPATRQGLKGAQLAAKGNSILLDEVVCIAGYVDEDGRMIADDVIFPDIPTSRNIGRATRDVYAAFISDIHCGSKEYLEDEFDTLINWFRGEDVDEADKDMSVKTEYLFIAGDIVDGIGVYPTQKDELLIPNLYDQYAFIAKKLRRLPERVTVIAIPGNHDACRQALPRPPFAEEFAQPLYELGEHIMLLGEPALIEVEGVKILLTHGDSMDDLVVNSPGASYTKPEVGMRELLVKRHLAPVYGGKTELAPLSRDWLVLETPPDIVHFGHSHHNAIDNYRGIQIINSGTFQAQTDFMRKQGIVPTPGIVTFINLQNGHPTPKFFYDVDKFAQ